MSKRRINVGRCQCGGRVYGERSFGRLWTWCGRCSPVVKVVLGKGGVVKGTAPAFLSGGRSTG